MLSQIGLETKQDSLSPAAKFVIILQHIGNKAYIYLLRFPW
jgi:hypothetical protein